MNKAKEVNWICPICKKELYLKPWKIKYRSFCSRSCASKNNAIKWLKNKTGLFNPVNIKKGQKTNKINKTGVYGISKEKRKKLAYIMINICRKKKIGSFFNPEEHKKQIKNQIVNKIGWFDPKNIKKAHQTNKDNQTGFWNPLLRTSKNYLDGQKKANATNKEQKKGIYGFSKKQKCAYGIMGSDTNRKNKIGPFFNQKWNRKIRLSISQNRGSYLFKNILYDSKGETEIAMCIYYQYNLDMKKYSHFNVGLKEHDFFIPEYKCFIEYHPYDRNVTLNTYCK